MRKTLQNNPNAQGDTDTMRTVAKVLLVGSMAFAGATHMLAQGAATPLSPAPIAQIVALDECEPSSFNAMLGPDFCKNVAIGATTPFLTLFHEADEGHPDPNWDFEPDTLNIKQGTIVNVANEGGEPHTFTPVDHFGGGFIAGLNAGENTVPECNGGFANVAVARTRILQGSNVNVTGLSKGEHLFQCCIHPWMRVKVEVK
jgi:plastocyanin